MTSSIHLALPILWIVLSLLLSACKPHAADPRLIGPPEQAGLTRCGGDAVEPLIGQPVAAMPAKGGWGALRVISPGMAVTEDYSESRLNVMVDEDGLILAVTCG